MPGTSTAFTFCDGIVRLDDPLGNLLNVSGSGNKIDMELGNKITEFNTFEDGDWPQSLQCGKNAKIKFSGVGTTAIGELRELIEAWYFYDNRARTFQVDAPPEGLVLAVRYEAEVRIETFKFSGEAGKSDPVMYEIDFKLQGILRRMRLPS